jgi:N-acetylmuramoyl-L-alanine amidase
VEKIVRISYTYSRSVDTVQQRSLVLVEGRMDPDEQSPTAEENSEPIRTDDAWEEGEEAGDERLPFDPGDEVPSPAELEDGVAHADEAPPPPRTPLPPPKPDYPRAPCYVTVGQGDCVLSLAKRYRRLPKQICEAPENAELLQRRKHNVLLPGDRVFIPAVVLKEADCATEKRHRFKLLGGTCLLKLQLLRDGKPRTNLSYVLHVCGRDINGSTAASGMLETQIPADATEGTLRLLDPSGEEVYHLNFGHMNPVEDVTGAQARLNNLGFACGPVDGDAGPMTQAALAAFQLRHGLEATGCLDAATRSKLLEVHGS